MAKRGVKGMVGGVQTAHKNARAQCLAAEDGFIPIQYRQKKIIFAPLIGNGIGQPPHCRLLIGDVCRLSRRLTKN
jgi:hypothetical protein